MKKVLLPCKDLSIELNVDTNGWCSLFLHQRTRLPLGSDSKEIIKKRFLSILDSESFPNGTDYLNGKEYVCFLTLFEEHTSGFARKESDHLSIVFTDDLSEILLNFKLTPNQAKEWATILNKSLD